MSSVDPILLEVLRNRLDTIADEMELTLLKSAASPIVKEGLDASAALFTVRGETVAQAAAIPIHLGALQFAARRIVRGIFTRLAGLAVSDPASTAALRTFRSTARTRSTVPGATPCSVSRAR